MNAATPDGFVALLLAMTSAVIASEVIAATV
jgi:hypothetical protein